MLWAQACLVMQAGQLQRYINPRSIIAQYYPNFPTCPGFIGTLSRAFQLQSDGSEEAIQKVAHLTLIKNLCISDRADMPKRVLTSFLNGPNNGIPAELSCASDQCRACIHFCNVNSAVKQLQWIKLELSTNQVSYKAHL